MIKPHKPEMRDVNAEPSDAAKALAAKISDLEKLLNEQTKTPHPDEKALKATRTSLRDKFEQLILLDHEYSCRLQCEVNLWKKVFYKRIDTFRKQLAKAKGGLDDPGKRERAEIALTTARASFAKFLDDSKAFYHSFLSKLLHMCGVSVPGYSKQEKYGGNLVAFAANERPNGLSTCQKCLIYLGDLERYYQLECSEEGKTDWTLPWKHYFTASRLLPNNGNPYNQMGVLATYREDDLEGVYCYARAILVAWPCILARNNLKMVFEKNEGKFEAMVRGEGEVSGMAYLTATAMEKKRRLAAFSLQFVRLHAMLAEAADFGGYDEMESKVLQDFMSLNDLKAMDLETTFKVVVTCIFTAHDLDLRLSSSAADEPNCIHLARAFNYALGLCFRFFDKLSVLARGSDELLIFPCIITEWLMHNLRFVVGPCPSEERADNGRELRGARQSFVQHIVDLLSLVKQPGQQSIMGYRPLQEDIDLCGFVPLAGAHKALLTLCPNEVLVGTQGVCVDHDSAQARLIRIGRIEAFAQCLAAGAQPLLFYDSQKGDYSVEGDAVMTVKAGGVSTVGVHSQHRGMQLPHALATAATTTQHRINVHSSAGGSSDFVVNRPTAPLSYVNGGGVALMSSAVGEDADIANDETFGMSMVAPNAHCVPTDLSSFAQQSLSFASDATSGFKASAGEGHKGVCDMPEREEEASDEQLEHLVGEAISMDDAYMRRASVGEGVIVGSMMEDNEVEDEIILFRPTAQPGINRRFDARAGGEDDHPAYGLAHNMSRGERAPHAGSAAVDKSGAGRGGLVGEQTTPHHQGVFWGGFGDVNPFGGSLILGEGAAQSGSLTWQGQALIPSTGAQAALHDGSTEVVGGMYKHHGAEAQERRRFATNNPFAA